MERVEEDSVGTEKENGGAVLDREEPMFVDVYGGSCRVDVHPSLTGLVGVPNNRGRIRIAWVLSSFFRPTDVMMVVPGVAKVAIVGVLVLSEILSRRGIVVCEWAAYRPVL